MKLIINKQNLNAILKACSNNASNLSKEGKEQKFDCDDVKKSLELRQYVEAIKNFERQTGRESIITLASKVHPEVNYYGEELYDEAFRTCVNFVANGGNLEYFPGESMSEYTQEEIKECDRGCNIAELMMDC